MRANQPQPGMMNLLHLLMLQHAHQQMVQQALVKQAQAAHFNALLAAMVQQRRPADQWSASPLKLGSGSSGVSGMFPFPHQMNGYSIPPPSGTMMARAGGIPEDLAGLGNFLNRAAMGAAGIGGMSAFGPASAGLPGDLNALLAPHEFKSGLPEIQTQSIMGSQGLPSATLTYNSNPGLGLIGMPNISGTAPALKF